MATTTGKTSLNDKKNQLWGLLRVALLEFANKQKKDTKTIQPKLETPGLFPGDQESFCLMLNGNEAIIAFSSVTTTRSLGYSAQELRGTSALGIFDPGHRNRFFARYCDLLKKIKENPNAVDEVSDEEPYAILPVQRSMKPKNFTIHLTKVQRVNLKKPKDVAEKENCSREGAESYTVLFLAIKVD